ncbi:hypothetical protein OC845_001658 [Tilletia horrida]|nr:hypothetical protein OC845_001658 [Tilletia horrida]
MYHSSSNRTRAVDTAPVMVIIDQIPPTNKSYLTCQPFQLQPAPRPRKLSKQDSKDTLKSAASHKTSYRPSELKKIDIILAPSDFRSPLTKHLHELEPYPEIPVDKKPDSDTMPCSCRDHDGPASQEPNDLDRASSPTVRDAGQARWRGALPYRSTPATTIDTTTTAAYANEAHSIQILVTGPESPADKARALDPLSIKHDPPMQQQGRGDGWGGIRAPTSWFENSFVPGPLATPTPSVIEARETGKVDADILLPLRGPLATKRRSLIQRSLASLRGASVVPPLPPLILTSDGMRATEPLQVIKKSKSGGGEQHDEGDGLEGKNVSIGQPPAAYPSARSTHILLKGSGDIAQTTLDVSHLPVALATTQHHRTEGQTDEPEDGWKERLVSAVQSALRQTSAASSGARASLALLPKRRKDDAGATNAPNRFSLTGVRPTVVHEFTREDLQMLNAIEALNGKDGHEKDPIQTQYNSQNPSGRSKAPEDDSARPISLTEFAATSRIEGQRREQESAGQAGCEKATAKGKRRQICLFVLLGVFGVVILANIILLNVKVLAKPEHGEVDTISSDPLPALPIGSDSAKTATNNATETLPASTTTTTSSLASSSLAATSNSPSSPILDSATTTSAPDAPLTFLPVTPAPTASVPAASSTAPNVLNTPEPAGGSVARRLLVRQVRSSS